MGDPIVVESWHVPWALSGEALRLLTSLPMKEIERRILVPVPAPIPVRERPWERDRWCDERGQCWMGDPGGGGFIPSWRLCRPEDAPNMKVSLPAHALPLPEVE